jgi:putative mRNA 3-end processing factor
LHPRQGDFYIDQWKPAHKAIITHAHDDHVRAGSSSFYALQNT